MTQEYKTELRMITRARRKLVSDLKRFERNQRKAINTLWRDRLRGRRNTNRELARIDRRIGILRGRLS